MKMKEYKIDVERNNTGFVWRIYSNYKHVRENTCACVAWGRAQTASAAIERANDKLEILTGGKNGI